MQYKSNQNSVWKANLISPEPGRAGDDKKENYLKNKSDYNKIIAIRAGVSYILTNEYQICIMT